MTKQKSQNECSTFIAFYVTLGYIRKWDMQFTE